MPITHINWTPSQIKFINLIKESPIIWTSLKKKKNIRRLEKNAWGNIAKIMHGRSTGSWDCRKRWSKIKMHYGKLKVLTETGKLPKESIEAYPIIKKYFDGTLSFLDPHLGDLSNPKMLKKFPTNKRFDNFVESLCHASYTQVHKFIKRHSNLKRSNDEEDLNPTDYVFVMDMFSRAVKESLDALFVVKETENIKKKLESEVVENDEVKIIETCNYNIENNNISLKGKAIDTPPHAATEARTQAPAERQATARLHLGEGTEFVVKKLNEFETEDNLMEVNESDTVQYTYTSENLIKIDVDDNGVEVDYSNTMSFKENESQMNKDSESGVSDIEMRRFFEELGYAMSLELTLEKQLKLKMQINALVKSTLS